MRIGILQCGAPPEALAARHGTYADMAARLLGPGRAVVTYDAARGRLPPAADACDGYVMTGSPAGVYDDLPWIAPLLGFLRQARGRAKLVGLCFGHQAMAQAFGGEVAKWPGGWGVGLHRYDVRHRAAWMDGAAAVHAAASHQDQVTACPPDARVALSSPFTRFAGLDYGDCISFQFHPEFDAAFATALIESRRAVFGALADDAIASYAGPDDRARVAGWIGRFLGGGRPVNPSARRGAGRSVIPRIGG